MNHFSSVWQFVPYKTVLVLYALQSDKTAEQCLLATLQRRWGHRLHTAITVAAHFRAPF
jgi:hypothetical protein